MSRTKHRSDPCGCKWVIEPNGRETWTDLCPPHGAEHRALHEQAQRDRTEQHRIRALEEEFT